MNAEFVALVRRDGQQYGAYQLPRDLAGTESIGLSANLNHHNLILLCNTVNMSAYGAISRSAKATSPLSATIWKSSKGDHGYVTMHHLTLATADALPGLVSYLHACFAEELARGNTYPQEIMENEIYTQDMFEAYYFAVDVIVAIIGQDSNFSANKSDGEVTAEHAIEIARSGRLWEACVAGCYYVSNLSDFHSVIIEPVFTFVSR